MIHDPALLERLSAFGTERFDGDVFRATRRSLDPLAGSTSGGRWAPRGEVSVLYTSLLRERSLKSAFTGASSRLRPANPLSFTASSCRPSADYGKPGGKMLDFFSREGGRRFGGTQNQTNPEGQPNSIA